MNKPKVLYLHHAKDFSSNSVYLSDDFLLANKSLFGAQEMDSWAGYRILTRDFLVYRLQISVNLSAIQLSLPNGDSLSPITIRIPTGFRAKTNREYIESLIKYLDTSFALFSDSLLSKSITEIIRKFDISLVWSDTQFYSPFLPSEFRVLIRSVNFEPLHVLREDPSPLRLLRMAGKVWSEKRTLREREVIAISPRDAFLYSKLAHRKVKHLPLRQLGFLLKQSPNWSQFSNPTYPSFVYFAGSNFDVKHNRDNLINLITHVAPALAELNPEIFLLVFGHRFPKDLKVPFNVRHMYFRDDFHNLASLALASLVPNKGGAGMQSKIFEPLCRGIPLIAHSGAIAGYPFDSATHFWKGDSVAEIIDSLDTIINRPTEGALKAKNSKELAQSLFGIEFLRKEIMDTVKDYSDKISKNSVI
jgi:hypothetical protein